MDKLPDMKTVVTVTIVTSEDDCASYAEIVGKEIDSVADATDRARNGARETYESEVGDVPAGHRYIIHIVTYPVPATLESVVTATISDEDDGNEPVFATVR